jgi:hypothetical protein
MSREIKFMAWDKRTGNLLDVRDLHWDNHGGMEIELSCSGKYYGSSEVDLFQFTGLLDKEGKEIYEGHIVKVENKHDSVRHRAKEGEGIDFIAPVEWKHSQWYVGYGTFKNWCLGQLWDMNADLVEIIGHIAEEENNGRDN